jgi:hypothetical protein
MGKLLTVSVLLVAAASCLRAQDQERKLVDRLLRPDMTLRNTEQKKKFIADGTSINKRQASAHFTRRKTEFENVFEDT